MPSELQSHLELNLPRLNTYDLLRREIVTFAENRRAFTVDDSGAIPMEVDYAKGKGQAKGKGKEKETRKCHKCGKAGHLVKDCWSTTDIRKNKDAGGSSGSGGNPKTPTPGGRGRGNPPKGRAQGRGRGGKGNRGGHARELEGEEEEPENEEPEQEEEYEAEVGFIGMLEGEGEDPGEGDGEPKKTEGKKEKKKKEKKKEGAHEGTDDESWGGWQPDSGAGSSRDPPEGGRARASAAKAAGGTPSMTGVGLRLLEGNLLAELQGRQAELNRALANTEDTEERSDLEAQLEVVTRQLKELAAKRRAARASPAGSWRTSSRILADVRSGRKASLAKRKELSRQRAARHRQASREGRARQRVALDGEWHRRYNRPLKGDDGKRDAYPLMPESTEREARPLSRKARENLRQEGAGDDVPEEHIRSWREKPKTPGEREGKRRREAARKKRKAEQAAAASGSAGPASGPARAKAAAKPKEPPGPRGKEVKGTDRPAEPSGEPPRRRSRPKHSAKVAEAIRTAPWRNNGKLPRKQEKKVARRAMVGPRLETHQGARREGQRPKVRERAQEKLRDEGQ